MPVKYKKSPAKNTKTKRKHKKHHPSEVQINLDSTRSDLKPLLEKLNPILKRIVDKLRERPDEEEQVCVDGYHNVKYCDHRP